MSKELSDMKKQIANLLKMEQLLTNTTLLYGNAQGTDCADISKKCPRTSGRDGVYNIRLTCNKLKQVYCDMSTDNGGRTVIQRRMDGSVDFYRNWTEYQNGFGNAYSEYWIGNEILHKLTSARNYELRVDMQRFNGEKAYALYSNFSVGDENSKYQLTVQGYSGNAGAQLSFTISTMECLAGGSLTYINKMKFSTVDQDNDNFARSHSANYESAGWFKACYHTNPNGQYTNSEKKSTKYINWFTWKNSNIALKKIQFMIRPRA
ncbi:fibrinogen-like protein A [Crassostrea virginica]